MDSLLKCVGIFYFSPYWRNVCVMMRHINDCKTQIKLDTIIFWITSITIKLYVKVSVMDGQSIVIWPHFFLSNEYGSWNITCSVLANQQNTSSYICVFGCLSTLKSLKNNAHFGFRQTPLVNTLRLIFIKVWQSFRY